MHYASRRRGGHVTPGLCGTYHDRGSTSKRGELVGETCLYLHDSSRSFRNNLQSRNSKIVARVMCDQRRVIEHCGRGNPGIGRFQAPSRSTRRYHHFSPFEDHEKTGRSRTAQDRFATSQSVSHASSTEAPTVPILLPS